MGVTVRRASLDDIDWLLVELEKFSKFYGSKNQIFDEPHARNTLPDLIGKHLFLVADQDGKPAGFIAGLVFGHLFNPNLLQLQECFWWVKEEYRGGRAGLLLLDAFIEWGKANVDWVTCVLEDKSPVSDRVLLKRGFRAVEATYLLEVTGGN